MQRVVITGMGIISPVGNNIDFFWQNLVDGVCGIGPITAFETENVPIKIAAEVKNFNPADYELSPTLLRKSDRYAHFALAAAYQAMAQSKLKANPEEMGVYIGSGIGGMSTFISECRVYFEKGAARISPLFIPSMIANMASANVAMVYNAQGPCLPVVTACATATHSIGEAYRAIKHGYAKAIIAGGAEAAIEPISIGGFNNSKALSRTVDPLQASLPFDVRRQGFVMGEGAGILVLESLDHALERGAHILAEVTGYGNTCDAYHYTAPRPDGAAAAKAMQIALQESDFRESDLLYINAHGTGTPLNDKSETMAIHLALGEEAAHKARISSTKSMTGHMLGAAGAAELIACVKALDSGIIPPTIGLTNPDPECDLDYTPLKAQKAPISIAISNSLGFGGHNACVALRAFK